MREPEAESQMKKLITIILAVVMLSQAAALASSARADEALPTDEIAAEAHLEEAADAPLPDADGEEPRAEETELPALSAGIVPDMPLLDGAMSLGPALYSSDIIQIKLYALQDTYYPGMPWGDYEYYTSPVMGGGSACLAFAFKMSDLVFDDLSYRKLYRGEFSYDDIHVGDILWEREWVRHAVVVLEKHDDHLCFVEGNFNSAVLWGREKSKQDCMDLYEVLITRYPEHLAGDVSGDKCLDTWDAASLMQHLVNGWSISDAQTADANSDGRITTADAAYILMLNAAKQDGVFLRETE